MSSQTVTPSALPGLLAEPPAGPIALCVPIATAAEAEAVVGALRGHRRRLARSCVGVAAVTADDGARAVLLDWAGRITCPLTVLPADADARGWLAGQLAVGLRGVRPRGGSRTVGLSPDLQDYIEAHFNPPADPIGAALVEATRARFPRGAGMCIGEDQGRVLKLLVELSGARHVVEVGTFTGTSSLWMARGLPPKGRLTCFELDPAPLELARTAWAEAGVAERITVELGPAAEGLARLPAAPCVDMAFVDADKEGYQTYLDLLLPRLRPGGLIVVDNTLWGGSVADARVDDVDTRALRRFNDRLAADPTLDVLLLSVGDGLTIVRRRPA